MAATSPTFPINAANSVSGCARSPPPAPFKSCPQAPTSSSTLFLVPTATSSITPCPPLRISTPSYIRFPFSAVRRAEYWTPCRIPPLFLRTEANRILHAQLDNNDVDIMISNADGTSPRKLATQKSATQYTTFQIAHWSPDGKRIVAKSPMQTIRRTSRQP